MENYGNTVELPYTKTKIQFREISTNDQIALAKAGINFQSSREDLLDYFDISIDNFKNSLKDKNVLLKINVVEYVLFLAKLRMLSVGNTMEFFVKEGESKIKIQIDLNHYMLKLYENTKSFDDEMIENDIKIKLNWPTLEVMDLIKSNKKDYEMVMDCIIYFIEFIEIKGKKIVWNDFEMDLRQILFNKLPIKIKNLIESHVYVALQKLADNEVFGISFFKNERFGIFNLSFIEHIKMFFSYDIKSLYQEIYLLSSYGINTDYILNISPSERKIYIGIIQEQKKSKEDEKDPNTMFDRGMSQAVKDLAVEFGQV